MSAAQKLGVSFTPPAGYRAMNPAEVPPAARAAMSGASVFFVGPITNKFATNVNLVVQPSGGQKVLPADLPAQLEAAMRSQMPSYKILGSGRLTVAGTPAVRVDGSLISPPRIRRCETGRFSCCGASAFTCLRSRRRRPRSRATFPLLTG
jgi:hypothetical protein